MTDCECMRFDVFGGAKSCTDSTSPPTQSSLIDYDGFLPEYHIEQLWINIDIELSITLLAG